MSIKEISDMVSYPFILPSDDAWRMDSLKGTCITKVTNLCSGNETLGQGSWLRSFNIVTVLEIRQKQKNAS